MALLLALLQIVQVTPSAPSADVPADRAKAAFAHIRQLAGEWDQASTNGWAGVTRTKVIARGSAVLMSSDVEPHPAADETMATVFHLDGGRLLLTHYCVAGNQPRLVATSISTDGRRIEFALLDATNLPSPAAGHMNRAVYTIESPDRYRSRWTFSQAGREQWMEEILATRRR